MRLTSVLFICCFLNIAYAKNESKITRKPSQAGQTVTERRTQDMIIILQSPELTQLSKQKDGLGNITGISFIPSMTEDAHYQIQFSSQKSGTEQNCVVDVVNWTLKEPVCQAAAKFQTESKCKKPSPTGCLD